MTSVFDAAMRDKAKELGQYRDNRYKGSLREQEEKLRMSTTLYIGNLSYYTREEQVMELFSRAGEVKRVIMGLDRFKKTPYYTREDAEIAVRALHQTRLDERIIRVDWDAGFTEGRQYGRGKHGGQVRDEFRKDYDEGRGGWSKAISDRA